VCGTDCGGSALVSLCCVWERFVWFWGSEIMVCVGEFGAGLRELVFCCVCERLVWV